MKRIAVELEDDLFDRLNTLIPWGVKASMIRQLLELVVEGVTRGGDEFIGALLTGHICLAVRKEDDPNVPSG